MKKIISLILFIAFTYFIIPMTSFAAGSILLNPKSLSITEGNSATFTIRAVNAAGKVDISSSNPSVAEISTSTHWLDCDTLSVTVRGISAGTSTITVKLSDVVTYDEEQLSGSYSVSVSVNKKNVGNSNSAENIPNPTKNNDATLKKITIEGYSLDFSKDITDYNLTVGNEIASLKISATASVPTSSFVITGADHLGLGENIVSIIVTAEDGTKKDYIINVTRKDDIPETTLENLDAILSNATKDVVSIKILADSVLSEEVIGKIKASGKDVYINKYNEEHLLYSWKFKNKNIDSLKEFNSELLFSTDKKENIDKLANYADMIYLNFAHSGDLPTGTNIKIFVGDKYKNEEYVKLYYYNEKNNKMELIRDKLKVKDGYVEISMKHCSEYIITKSTISNKVKTKVEDQSKSFNFYWIILLLEAVIIVVLLLIVHNNRKKLKNI